MKKKISESSTKDLKKFFEDRGIVLKEEEVKEYNIESMYKNRKITQFIENPILTDLKDNTDIIPNIITLLRTPNNPKRQLMLEAEKGMSVEEIIRYIDSMSKPVKKSVWNNKWLVMCLLTIIMVAIALAIHRISLYLGFIPPKRPKF